KIQFLNTAPKVIHTKLQEQYAASALIMQDQTKILVGFSEPFFSEIIDTIFVGNIFDLAGVTVDQNYNSAAFCYEKPKSEPYLQKVDIVNRYCIHLYFSESMQKNSLKTRDNYQLHPSGGVEEIKILDSLFNTQVELILNKNSFAGSFGKPCYLILQNLTSADGVLLRETDKINLFKQELNLENILIYPQPVKPQHNEIIFAKLPQNVEIRIFNINGKLIKILDGQTIFGGIHWDLKDTNKSTVRSGVYIYEIIHNNEKRYGKLVIVR
ncbi:MAG: T9SS type A sorting domain-containing protein, partial [Calditrichales bacterium]|nr:T9SS type A sorting domain-containing protein [Calditrichales bacterium]